MHQSCPGHGIHDFFLAHWPFLELGPGAGLKIPRGAVFEQKAGWRATIDVAATELESIR